jgi:AcrR family transcriptional regulator
MADTLDNAPPTRRRRSDARRSNDAILNAARIVLSDRPDASMDDIATAAGVTRQTVYAHFSTRDALIAALLHVAATEIIAAIDTVPVDAAPPADALRRFFDILWELMGRYPLLLDPGIARVGAAVDGSAAHRAGTARLEQIIRRGQQTGDFDRTLSAPWLAAATLGLLHTAVEQVTAGHLTNREAAALLLDSALRLAGRQRG